MRYYTDPHPADSVIEDVKSSADAGELVPIIDRSEGGIIAYATSEEDALRIVYALEYRSWMLGENITGDE